MRKDGQSVRMKRLALLLSALLCCGGPLRAGGAAHEPATCAGIRALTREQAAEGRPVVLRGVITSGQKRLGAFVLHDGTAGIYVTPSQGEPPEHRPTEWVKVQSLEAGGLVEVRGITGPGGFAPLVVAQRVEFTGTGPLPPAAPVTLADLRSGAYDCQPAELRGVVQRWHREAGSNTLWMEVAEQGGSFSAYADAAPDIDGAGLVDAEVRLRGTCFSFFNARGEIVGLRLRMRGAEDLDVTRPAAADPFAAPEVPALALRPFQPGPPNLHRQRLSGVVTLARPGRFLYVQTRERGFRVETHSAEVFAPGDAVDAAGFVGQTEHFGIMTNALLRHRGKAAVPVPARVTSAMILEPKFNPRGRELRIEDYDGSLVTLRARLVRVEDVPDEGARLYLDSGGSLIRAGLGPGTTAAALALLQVESEVDVTGVCAVELDQEWPADVMPVPVGFSLLLRSPADVQILRAPSWWTQERVLWLLAGVGTLAALTAAWAFSLRRRVVAQTEIIREKIERASVLGERERIARELHDTVEQELMGVNMLLEETRTRLPADAERARDTLSLAHRMLRHCREESRSSIRDLRSVALENLGLPAALDELLRPVAEMNGARFTVSTAGTPRRLPASRETGLLRLCHEAVANAARHSGAQHIALTLTYGGTETSVEVTDDGCGFDPKAPRPSGAHFGLPGMEERADKISARLHISSAPGRGTVVSIRLSDS